MGEPAEKWAERIKLLLPYQVNARLFDGPATPRSLPALPARAAQHRHGDRCASCPSNFGVDALEVTEEVFESATSIVFDQAENRLHTIKALMVATLARD